MSSKIDVLKIDKNMTIEAVDENGLVWLNPTQEPFKLIGFNWFERDKVYRRFPVNPKYIWSFQRVHLTACQGPNLLSPRWSPTARSVRVWILSLASWFTPCF